jgi:hypothetical protein
MLYYGYQDQEFLSLNNYVYDSVFQMNTIYYILIDLMCSFMS